MNLLIDLGNTRLKWAFSDGDGLRAGSSAITDDSLDRYLREAWSAEPAPAKIVACTVGRDEGWRRLTGAVGARWPGSTPYRLTAQAEQLGIRNRYRDPGELGADRWAAAIGARALTSEDVCIVDCGTAVTVDLLTAGGEFLGGAIFPGLALLRASLTRGTSGVKTVDGGDWSSVAQSTADAVAAGTAFGLVGAIERLIREAESVADNDRLQVLITGGDAEYLGARLARPVQHVPDLVLRGLQRVAESL